MWDVIFSEVVNGQLCGYIVYIKDYYNYDLELVIKYNVSFLEMQIVIGYLDGGRKYVVVVMVFIVEEGFYLEWQEFIVGMFG